MAHAHSLVKRLAARLCPWCTLPLGHRYAMFDMHPECGRKATPCDLCNQALGDEEGPAHKQCIEEEMERVDANLLP